MAQGSVSPLLLRRLLAAFLVLLEAGVMKLGHPQQAALNNQRMSSWLGQELPPVQSRQKLSAHGLLCDFCAGRLASGKYRQHFLSFSERRERFVNMAADEPDH